MLNDLPDDVEELLPILNIYKLIKKDGNINIAIGNINDHTYDPAWVASMMFLLLDRYTSATPESTQNDFQRETLSCFSKILEIGEAYISKILVGEEE